MKCNTEGSKLVPKKSGNMFASKQEPVRTRPEDISSADDMGWQSEGEWLMWEPKMPPSANFLHAAEETERMQRSHLMLSALELQNGCSKMDSETNAEFEARASQLKVQYQVQLREYRQSGRFKSVHSDSRGHVKSTMPEFNQVRFSMAPCLRSEWSSWRPLWTAFRTTVWLHVT